MKIVPLDAITLLEETQIRAALDEDTIAHYAARIKAGDTFPPVGLRDDGQRLILGPGRHRVAAHRKLGRAGIAANVQPGSAADALLDALEENRRHGRAMTREDRGAAVRRLLVAFPGQTQEWIAEQADVAQGYVSGIRKKMEAAGELSLSDNSKRGRPRGSKKAPPAAETPPEYQPLGLGPEGEALAGKPLRTAAPAAETIMEETDDGQQEDPRPDAPAQRADDGGDRSDSGSSGPAACGGRAGGGRPGGEGAGLADAEAAPAPQRCGARRQSLTCTAEPHVGIEHDPWTVREAVRALYGRAQAAEARVRELEAAYRDEQGQADLLGGNWRAEVESRQDAEQAAARKGEHEALAWCLAMLGGEAEEDTPVETIRQRIMDRIGAIWGERPAPAQAELTYEPEPVEPEPEPVPVKRGRPAKGRRRKP